MRINNFLLLAVTATVQLSSLPFTSASRMCTNGLSNYGCGAGYQEDGYFDEPAGDNCICCCRHEDGSGFMTAHAMALRPTQRDVALAWVTWLVMVPQMQRLVTIAVWMINLAMDWRIRPLKNTLAALIELAKKWKGQVLAVIVVESVAIATTLACACGTLPSGITHVKKNTVAVQNLQIIM